MLWVRFMFPTVNTNGNVEQPGGNSCGNRYEPKSVAVRPLCKLAYNYYLHLWSWEKKLTGISSRSAFLDKLISALRRGVGVELFNDTLTISWLPPDCGWVVWEMFVKIMLKWYCRNLRSRRFCLVLWEILNREVFGFWVLGVSCWSHVVVVWKFLNFWL